VAKTNPILGAEGVVLLVEKFWPSLQHVDGSSGSLGNAVYSAIKELLPILIDAPADRKTRDKWLNQLWEAIQDDGVEDLSLRGDSWGEICGSKETASAWAEEMLPLTRHDLTDSQPGIPFHGTYVCLSSLLAAERYQELLDLLDASRYKFWPRRKFGVSALLKMGKKAEAIKYAENARGLNTSDACIDQTCEEILISSGLYEEAYQRYGLTAHTGMTYIARFRAVAKRYPMKDKSDILKDLIVSTPGEEGKWFATAKDIGLYDLAIELALRSPCDPKTLNRAARNFYQENPKFALGAAMASLKWMSEGWGYELTNVDVMTAFEFATRIADCLGISTEVKNDIRKIVDNGLSSGEFVREILAKALGCETP